MTALRYSKKALMDLDQIAQYTLENWGVTQTERYIDDLQSVCLLLFRHPDAGRVFHASKPTWRRMEHGSHIILYEHTNGDLVIKRIVHERRLLEKLGR